LTEEEKILHEEYMFHTPPSFITPEISQFERYLLAQFKCFVIPRGEVELDIDIIANMIISVALLVKALDKAKMVDQINRYFIERESKSLPGEVAKILSASDMILDNRLQHDLEFFTHYDLENPDQVNYDKSPHSSISMALKDFTKSEQNDHDILKFVKMIMPFYAVIRDFLNDNQVKEEAINLEKMQAVKAADGLLKKDTAKEASKNFKELLCFFKSAKLQNVNRQLMLGRTLMNMALCAERQNEPLQALVFYLRSQSVLGRLMNIEDSKERYRQCDKKILELEGMITAGVSTCNIEV